MFNISLKCNLRHKAFLNLLILQNYGFSNRLNIQYIDFICCYQDTSKTILLVTLVLNLNLSKSIQIRAIYIIYSTDGSICSFYDSQINKNLVCGQQPNLKLKKQTAYINYLYYHYQFKTQRCLYKNRVILADDKRDLVKLR